ncbi:MAG TPA: DNA primase [Verrucomicrobia bacterium]|nr:MAG: DNA primase [Lentisphaerae bacterium GWF2_57_35]HBA84990.1 DNA primase [Verrucomicrobiota bacterium]
MSKIIPKDVIETIRMQNDIVDVLGSYLQLKRAGGTYKALCPFHKEKTPSFNVNPQRQIYHCFGCGAGGDVFKFIMEHERVDFGTAARMLAERVGIALQYTAEDRKEINKDLLYKIHEDVALFYHRCLEQTPEAEKARDYLASRELDAETVKDYTIGYAPTGNPLLKLAKKKGYAYEQLEACGLVMKSDRPEDEGRFFDRFRHRLMFPIRDELGRVIGFSGRILEKNDKLAKYVNSPETILFRKSRILFSLDKARKTIIDTHTAIICEGQIDCIRCQRAGFTNVVASQGTAITEDHAQLLKRYADSLILVLDADAAGQKAAIGAAEVFLGKGLSIRIAALPKGDDPDTLIRKQGAEAFQKVLDGAKSIIDFQIDVLTSREDIRNEDAAMRVAKAVLQTIAFASTPAQQEHMLKQMAGRLKLQFWKLQEQLRHQPGAPHHRTASVAVTPTAPAAHPIEEMMLAELIVEHAEVAELARQHLRLEHLTDPDCRLIIAQWLNRPEDPQWNLSAQLSEESEECRRVAAQIQMPSKTIVGDEASPLTAAQQVIQLVWRKHFERQRHELRLKMQSAPAEEREHLNIQCNQLTLDIKRLQHRWEDAIHIFDV